MPLGFHYGPRTLGYRPLFAPYGLPLGVPLAPRPRLSAPDVPAPGAPPKLSTPLRPPDLKPKGDSFPLFGHPASL